MKSNCHRLNDFVKGQVKALLNLVAGRTWKYAAATVPPAAGKRNAEIGLYGVLNV
jgi:hypothetical protein